MSQDLTNQKIKDTYQQVLHVDGGVTSTDKTVYDGDGTATGLKISTTGVDVTSLKIAGAAVTASAAEINFVDGVTSNVQTQLDAKVETLGDLSITATASELNLLDGATVTTAEINYLDGVTSAIQTQLNAKVENLGDLGVTATASELNVLDGITASTVELNYTDGVTSSIQTQLDAKAPTASPTFTGTITIPTADINGGSIDGVTLGTNSPVTNAQIDNININGNAITSTNSNGNIDLTPNGTGEVNISKVDIDSGAIDGTAIGSSSASTGAFTSVTATTISADFIQAKKILTTGSFTWDSATSSPAAVAGGQAAPVVTSIHEQMRGCVLNADGTVNYYLDNTDWSLKADGTASDLTGTDGNVMVEIPKFWYQVVYITTKPTWKISPVSVSGFTLHPAFIKDGVEVDFRYYGAYDACVYDVSATSYISGTNLDNTASLVDLTPTTGDKLASVKGVYPMVGLTRNEFRILAANMGAGWRQLDFTLWSAVQMLYLIEYQSFYSQNILGAGNTNGSYLASSNNQNDSPHTIAGAGDSLGSGSTDTTSGAGVNAKPGTSFMKYRGIENFYGNCWNWADGINVNVTANGNVHVTNNRADFADNTSTNMTLITSSLPTTSGYISDLLPVDPYMLPKTNSGSSTTYITDYHFASTSSNRVVLVGGAAFNGALAGAFCLASSDASSNRTRRIGGRLAF